MVYKTCYLRFRALPSWGFCASDASQVVYVTGALLKKARIGGIFVNICDCDVTNPRRTEYIKYYWTDIRCSNVQGAWRLPQRDAAGLSHFWQSNKYCFYLNKCNWIVLHMWYWDNQWAIHTIYLHLYNILTRAHSPNDADQFMCIDNHLYTPVMSTEVTVKYSVQ